MIYTLISSSKELFFERFPDLQESEVMIFDLDFFCETPYHDFEVRRWVKCPSIDKACDEFNNFLHLFSEDRDSKEVWIEEGTNLIQELQNRSKGAGKSPLQMIEMLCENKKAHITYISLILQKELAFT